MTKAVVAMENLTGKLKKVTLHGLAIECIQSLWRQAPDWLQVRFPSGPLHRFVTRYPVIYGVL